ncbi:MAG: amidohydrolase family protein [Planctomycetota bacterium]
MSEILDRWRAGEGLGDVPVIDGHAHVGEWPHGANYDTIDEMEAGVVAVMDANGVDAACVMGGGYMWGGTDYRIGNDLLLELWRRLGERIIPFAHFNPNDSRREILAELGRLFDAGVRGIKLINAYQHYPGDGANLMAVYDFAADRSMLILNHAWTADELAMLAKRHSGMDFICGHYGRRLDPLLRQFPNVHANIWSLNPLGVVEAAFGEVGPEKFLLGSDAFMNPISVGIGLVVYADIPDAHKRMILGENQARLLDKVGALPESLKRKLAS